MKNFLYLFLLALFMSQCRPKEENYVTIFPGKPEVPSAIKKEHEYLLDQIHKIISDQDSSCLEAIKLRDLMAYHFKEEEDYVLPPLGLLPLLASGKIPDHGKEIIQLTEKLKSRLALMSAEHQMIHVHLNEFKEACANEMLPNIVEFEKELDEHAAREEEIFFPTAILIGAYLKLNIAEQQN